MFAPGRPFRPRLMFPGKPKRGRLRQGKLTERGSISMVDLLCLTSSDPLLFILVTIFFFFYKTTYLNEKVKCTFPFCKGCLAQASIVKIRLGLKGYPETSTLAYLANP